MIVCVYCFKHARFHVPATTVVPTSSGINTACQPCADRAAASKDSAS